jgi:hypothetical protein
MGLSVGMTPFVPDYNKFTQNPQTAINTDTKAQDVVKENTAAGVRQKKAGGVQECQTCKNRRYQDGSNDPGVSFKSPTKISPGAAGSAVRAHEQEHVSRNASKAEREDREVISSSVQIFTAICPECGKPYVAGGETRTVTAARNQEDKKADTAKKAGAPGLDMLM